MPQTAFSNGKDDVCKATGKVLSRQELTTLFLLLLSKNKRGELDGGELFAAPALLIEHNPQETQMSRAVDQRGEITQLWSQILISSLLCEKKDDHLLCY